MGDGGCGAPSLSSGPKDYPVGEPAGCSLEKEQQKLGAKPRQKGEIIQAPNGVTVQVSDLFVSDDPEHGIVCLDFYAGLQKLNDRNQCLTYTWSPAPFFCEPEWFIDYGVKVSYWNVDPVNQSVVIAITNDVPGPIQNPADLFQACLAAGHDETGCMRYVARIPLPGEQLVPSDDNRIQTIVPGHPSVAGAYFTAQHEECTDALADLIGNQRDDLPAMMRYRVLSSPPYGYVGEGGLTGEAFWNNAFVVYATETTDQAWSDDLTLLWSSPGFRTCEVGTILHEGTHRAWTFPFQLDYFSDFLQEGAARWFEIFATTSPSVLVAEDVLLKKGEFHEVAVDPSNGLFDKIRFTVSDVTNDQILLLVENHDPDSGKYFGGEERTVDGPSLIRGIFGMPFKSLAVNTETLPDGTSVVRLRGLHLDHEVLGQYSLACREDNYGISLGLWLEGKFFVDTNVQVLFEGSHTPYYPLTEADNRKNQFMVYNTGACFFEGVRQVYDQHGKDVFDFWTALTKRIREHAEELTPEEQYRIPFCLLDTMQTIADSQLGANTFDVISYAQKFGVIPDETCHRLAVEEGGWRFGVSSFD